MATEPHGATAWLRDLIGRRPAESTTALVGALALLLATVLEAGEDVRTALVIVVASLPSLISFLHDLGRYGPGGRRESQRLSKELDILTLRAVHRARAGHPGWEADLDAVTKLADLERIRSAKPEAPVSKSQGRQTTVNPPGSPE